MKPHRSIPCCVVILGGLMTFALWYLAQQVPLDARGAMASGTLAMVRASIVFWVLLLSLQIFLWRQSER